MTTEERLEKLERELAVAKHFNRWMLTFVAMIIGGLGFVWMLTKSIPVAYAQETETVQKVIRANKFLLIDEKGKKKVELAGSGLTLFDENGEIRFVLGMTNGQPAMGFIDENGEIRAAMTACKKMGAISLKDENGVERIWLGVNNSGPSLCLYNEKAKECATLGQEKNTSTLSLKDENGKDRIILGMVGDVPMRGPIIALKDENDKPHATIAVFDKKPWICLIDEMGKSVWNAP